MALIIRREQPADQRAVELFTRDAFWGTEMPRCIEHLIVRRLREAACFVPELDLVADLDGEVVGNVMWARSQVVGEQVHEVLTFGPLTVHPAHQGRGVGAALMRHALGEAARLGHRGVVFYGHPDYYPRLGFRPAAEFGITGPGGVTRDALMALALVDGGLDGVRGEFREDPVFHVDQADAEAFDLAEFPPKEPAAPAPLDELEGQVPAPVLAALRAAGIPSVPMIVQHGARELADLPGVGPAGRDAVARAMHRRGMFYGPTRYDDAPAS